MMGASFRKLSKGNLDFKVGGGGGGGGDDGYKCDNVS